MKAWHAAVALALAVVAFTAARSQRGPSPVAVSPASAPRAAMPSQHVVQRMPELRIAFRLDPALTRSLYMGERWVSPPVFEFAQPGDTFTVRAKAQSIGRDGEPGDVSGDWSTGNPAMLAIERGHGEVTLVVREPGEADLIVATGAGTRTLHVKATRSADAMRVSFTQ